jgi:hypothetical protein
MNLHPKITCLPQAGLTPAFLAMSGKKGRQEGLSELTESYHLDPQIAIILIFSLTLAFFSQETVHNSD